VVGSLKPLKRLGKLGEAAEDVGKRLDDVAPRTITPRNAHLAGKPHPVTGVPFDADGYPNFSAVATRSVEITQSGNRAADFAAANSSAGLAETPKGFTWHHHQNGTTMQLVPTPIHRATGHTGGVALGGG
jgi:hypothetical protein